MDSKPLLIKELKDAFFSLKVNKSSGINNFTFNIIKKIFWAVWYLPISGIS